MTDCRHYMRSCVIFPSCCSLGPFPCHVCHDTEVSKSPAAKRFPTLHKLDRRSEQGLFCFECGEIQPAQALEAGICCRRCSAVFGAEYSCTDCLIFTHDPAQEFWHCHDCQLCRTGPQGSFAHKHCCVCQGCVSLDVFDDHTCFPNAMHYECVVCGGYLFNSRVPVAMLPRCKHLAIHGKCLQDALVAGTSEQLECILCSDQQYMRANNQPSVPVDNIPETEVYLQGKHTARRYAACLHQLLLSVLPSPQGEKGLTEFVHKQVVLPLHQGLKLSGGVTVDRVHVAGSLGRKTSVTGRFDADVLLFLNGYNPNNEAQVETVLYAVVDVLGDRIGDDISVKPIVQMLQFTVRADPSSALGRSNALGTSSGGGTLQQRQPPLAVSMDLVLLPNAVPAARSQGISASMSSNARVHRDACIGPLLAMTDAEIHARSRRPRSETSLSERGTAEALTEFVRAQHGIVNEATRLMKAWVKAGLVERRLITRKVPSVALELLVIAVHQRFMARAAEAAGVRQRQRQLGYGAYQHVPDMTALEVLEAFNDGGVLAEASDGWGSEDEWRFYCSSFKAAAGAGSCRYEVDLGGGSGGGDKLPEGVRQSRLAVLRLFLGALKLAQDMVQLEAEPVLLDANLSDQPHKTAGLGYSREQALRFRACWGEAPPWVIHPIDPSCNIAKARDEPGKPEWDWQGLAREAGALRAVVLRCSLGTLLQETSLGAALLRIITGQKP